MTDRWGENWAAWQRPGVARFDQSHVGAGSPTGGQFAPSGSGSTGPGGEIVGHGREGKASGVDTKEAAGDRQAAQYRAAANLARQQAKALEGQLRALEAAQDLNAAQRRTASERIDAAMDQHRKTAAEITSLTSLGPSKGEDPLTAFAAAQWAQALGHAQTTVNRPSPPSPRMAAMTARINELYATARAYDQRAEAIGDSAAGRFDQSHQSAGQPTGGQFAPSGTGGGGAPVQRPSTGRAPPGQVGSQPGLAAKYRAEAAQLRAQARLLEAHLRTLEAQERAYRAAARKAAATVAKTAKAGKSKGKAAPVAKNKKTTGKTTANKAAGGTHHQTLIVRIRELRVRIETILAQAAYLDKLANSV